MVQELYGGLLQTLVISWGQVSYALGLSFNYIGFDNIKGKLIKVFIRSIRETLFKDIGWNRMFDTLHGKKFHQKIPEVEFLFFFFFYQTFIFLCSFLLGYFSFNQWEQRWILGILFSNNIFIWKKGKKKILEFYLNN